MFQSEAFGSTTKGFTNIKKKEREKERTIMISPFGPELTMKLL